MLVSAIFRSQPNVQPGGDVATNGASRAANFLMTAAQFQAATGQSLRTGVTTETVNLLLPGQIYGDRVNNLDMRVAKIVRVKGTRANIGIDLYNLTNRNTGTTFEATYDPASQGARWMRPDGGAAAAVRPVQRAVRFLTQGAQDMDVAETRHSPFTQRLPNVPVPLRTYKAALLVSLVARDMSGGPNHDAVWPACCARRDHFAMCAQDFSFSRQ